VVTSPTFLNEGVWHYGSGLDLIKPMNLLCLELLGHKYHNTFENDFALARNEKDDFLGLYLPFLHDISYDAHGCGSIMSSTA